MMTRVHRHLHSLLGKGGPFTESATTAETTLHLF